MKHNEIARALARRGKISHAEARDKIDELVHAILKSLREGGAAEVPGIGNLVRQPRRPEPAPGDKRA